MSEGGNRNEQKKKPSTILNEMKYSIVPLIYDISMLRLLIAIVIFFLTYPSHKLDVANCYCDVSIPLTFASSVTLQSTILGTTTEQFKTVIIIFT